MAFVLNTVAIYRYVFYIYTDVSVCLYREDVCTVDDINACNTTYSSCILVICILLRDSWLEWKKTYCCRL